MATTVTSTQFYKYDIATVFILLLYCILYHIVQTLVVKNLADWYPNKFDGENFGILELYVFTKENQKSWADKTLMN